MPVAHSVGVFDGSGSAEVLASLALLVLPSLPDKALYLPVWPSLWMCWPVSHSDLILVVRYRSGVSECQGVPIPNKTP